jgi:hypothetical protein
MADEFWKKPQPEVQRIIRDATDIVTCERCDGWGGGVPDGEGGHMRCPDCDGTGVRPASRT